MPMKPRKQDNDVPASHLWVGNLPPDVTESDLSEVFGKYGLIDGITSYASRSYAFVYFKRAKDAVAAKDALQGFLINGSSIKIEFAKPAKPSKRVWVGGFGSSVTMEKLEEELSKFGNIEDFKFMRDRNTALVDFARLEDASAAVKNMNGLQIGDDRIRVDFLRSHPAKRDHSDFHDTGNSHFKGVGGDPSWINQDNMRNYPEPTYAGHKRPQPSQPFGRKGGQPSKILWVGYPPSVVIDEEMLHNAMILYGEIERIKCFRGRHYSFVEFRSVEEARRAKEALQGRLFNDPRISIMFSNSDSAPGKDFGPPYPAFRGQRPDMFGNEPPFGPPLMEGFPSNRAMLPNNFHGPPPPNGALGPGVPRPFGPRGGKDPMLPNPDFHDPNMLFSMSEMTGNAPANQRKMSPASSGLLPSPAPGRASHKTSGWDVLDPNQLPRDSKRSRIGGPTSGKGDEYIVSGDQPYSVGPQYAGGPLANSGLSTSDMAVAKGNFMGRASEDYIWRGVIAKGGNPVCHARCIPMGKGLECELPEAVNCSARTGLDMLAKHYAGAIGFDIVFFLPDSEEDFANYTEFLRYLGSKNRAGVAKLDDGTTLFLVPPSDFLTDVLKVSGLERLYGVVLKMPQQLPGGPSLPQTVHQSLPPIQHSENQLGPTHEYLAPEKDLTVHMDYGRAVHDDTSLNSKPPFPNASAPHEQSNDGVPSTSRPPVTLTPELVATLNAFLPANSPSSVAQPQFSSSSTGRIQPVSSNDKGAFSQGWSQQPQVNDPTGQSQQHFGVQGYPNAPYATNFHSYGSSINSASHPAPIPQANIQSQNPMFSYQDQGPVSSRPSNVHPVTAQSQQYLPPMQNMQPYPSEAPHNIQKGYGMIHGAPVSSFGMADSQQQSNPTSYTNQVSGANFSRPEIMLPTSTGNLNSESQNQPERSQTLPSGVGQGSSEVEVDKNQRYQSTLQFAANLLLQIQQQQQQQQASSHMGNQQ